jgi:hypothetical protein
MFADDTTYEPPDELAERLKRYVLGEPGDVAQLRTRRQGQFPWPSTDNPALEYLIKRTAHEFPDAGSDPLIWLAAHAWFEGALAALSLHSDADPEASFDMTLELMGQLRLGEKQAKHEHAAALREYLDERRKIIEGDAL